MNPYRECRHLRNAAVARVLAAVLCVAWLAGCSPTFDWRPVRFGQDGASGVLPDTPHAQTRQVGYDTWTLPLSMTSARAGSVLFALGAAPLPPDLAASASARERLARWAVESFYRNAGTAPPDPAPRPGERFTVHGQGPDGPIWIEAQVIVTDREWLEAVVIAAPDDYARAPVGDFWLSLRWPGASMHTPPGSPADQTRSAAGPAVSPR